MTKDYRKNDFQRIDALADKASQMNFTSPKKLAAFLTQGAKTDIEKVRAIYRWVTANINYDAKSFFSGSYEPSDAENVFMSRKSVCEGYANLFDTLAREAGIESQKISGFAKGYGYSAGAGAAADSKPNHAWNAVKLDGKWFLVDSTWGAGYLENRSFVRRFEGHYFLTPPEQFIFDHLPEDPRWQLLDKQISNSEYVMLPYLRPDFFKNGLRLIGYKAGQIKARDQFVFTLAGEDLKNNPNSQGKKNSSVMASLYLNNRELDKRQVFVQKKDDRFEISVRFPQKGEYMLRVFVKPQNEPGSYAWAGDFQVAADSGMPEVFPFAYDTSDKNVFLLTPLQGTLKQGVSYDFSLEAPGAEKIAVVTGKIWNYLKNEGGRFTGSVKAVKGDNFVYIKYPNESNFRGAYQYSGN
jgi:transglutaminase/protease-like cytokinesis protein 3